MHLSAQADYYPLARSSRWTYSVVITGGLLGVQEGTSTTAVEGEEKAGGKTYFRVRTSFAKVTFPPDLLLLRKDRTGIYKLDAGREVLMMPLPLKPGLTWTTPGPQGELIQNRVEGPETVDLATDKFDNCLKVVRTSSSAKSADYYAPNVGLVKTVGQMAGSRLDFFLDAYKP
jgi:hypothetical protein